MDAKIKAVFDNYPEDARPGLLKLRELIFEEAQSLPDIGPVEEVLRWGQPSYITPKVKAATTLRLGISKSGAFAIFAHCQSTVISDFAALFPQIDKVDGNRAVIFKTIDDIEPERHRLLIRNALTYHL